MFSGRAIAFLIYLAALIGAVFLIEDTRVFIGIILLVFADKMFDIFLDE